MRQYRSEIGGRNKNKRMSRREVDAVVTGRSPDSDSPDGRAQDIKLAMAAIKLALEVDTTMSSKERKKSAAR